MSYLIWHMSYGHDRKIFAGMLSSAAQHLELPADMVYALVHYPAVDTQHLNELRRKYDPQVDLIAPHITLVFPVPTSIGEASLGSHIEHVLRGWQQFPIRLQGLERSWDNYLFLLL